MFTSTGQKVSEQHEKNIDIRTLEIDSTILVRCNADEKTQKE